MKTKLILIILASLITGCATYQSTVDSRSIGIRGQTDGENVGGKIVYSVHYK